MTQINCPLCGSPLRFSLASSRRAKKKKNFVMLVCPKDGRHFRGFISDQTLVARLVEETAAEGLGQPDREKGMGMGRG